MPYTIEIYGSVITLPDPEKFSYIEDWGTSIPTEQYWRRKELPDFFEKVEYDRDENLLLTTEQSNYAAEEVRRCKQGFYFLSNGKLQFVTGKHYFYLQWWKLEDDIYPDYRDTDRRYFTFLDYWEHILWCLGILRSKKRREGASSQATANLMYECIFFKNSFCGLVSKSRDDSRDTFTDMVSFGYRQLPVFLKPRQLNNKDSVSELVFAHKSSTIKQGVNTIDNDSGHRSKINYKAPDINAYDRGRLSRILGDEGGKWDAEAPFSKFIGVVTKCLVKGAKRVGFGEFPSTINELEKYGGKEYKTVWDMANQVLYAGNATPSGMVRYFTPAYDGFEGFIDKYGMSVINEPDELQYQYLVDKYFGKTALSIDDIKMGAKAYLLKKRKDLKGDSLEEEIRMNPFTEDEAFMSAHSGCVFNLMNIIEREKQLLEKPIYKRKVMFEREMETQKVYWRDARNNEEDFHWEITWFPEKDNDNQFKTDGRVKIPARSFDGAITVDSYSNSQGGRKYGSKASAWIGRKLDISNPQNSGRAIGHLYGRPMVKEILHAQVMMAAEYYGYFAWYEHTADDYLSYFRERGKIGYLGVYPLSLIDPNKRNTEQRYRGTPITPFSLTKQLDNGISVVEHHCDTIDFDVLLADLKIFDPYDRTSYDNVVSWLMLISVLSEPDRKPEPRKSPLYTIYERQEYADN